MSQLKPPPQGEWLAFTSKADQAGYWDFGASIASGAENVTIEFRILVDADNCSLPETDGFNGLGTEGFDLLDGPLSLTETGSWEAFVLASKEDVWVEEGEHRLLFCADSGMFNLNYLWFFTPNPTPSPTPAPTLAPTPAPQVPSDPGPNIDWIYLAVSVQHIFRREPTCRLPCFERAFLSNVNGCNGSKWKYM